VFVPEGVPPLVALVTWLLVPVKVCAAAVSEMEPLDVVPTSPAAAVVAST
jgi:hypothetical protein